MLANSYDYDETGVNLTPRTTVSPQANWRLRLTPVISGALFAGYYYYNADNAGRPRSGSPRPTPG